MLYDDLRHALCPKPTQSLRPSAVTEGRVESRGGMVEGGGRRVRGERGRESGGKSETRVKEGEQKEGEGSGCKKLRTD